MKLNLMMALGAMLPLEALGAHSLRGGDLSLQSKDVHELAAPAAYDKSKADAPPPCGLKCKFMKAFGAKKTMKITGDAAMRSAVNVPGDFRSGMDVKIDRVQMKAGMAKVTAIKKSVCAKVGYKEEVFYFGMGRSVPNLAGRRPNLVRDVARVWYGKTNRPWRGYARNNDFAVRWTGVLVIITGGPYTFWIQSDDGSKLYIGSKVVVNNDGLHGMRTRAARKPLDVRKHPLKLEYFEKGGHAGMLLKFKGPDTGNAWSYGQSHICNTKGVAVKAGMKASQSGFKEEAFFFRMGRNVPNLRGRRPNFVRNVGRVWYGSTKKPWSGYARKDNYAVRWTGLLGIKRGGTYSFWIASDDGSKLYIDNQVVVNNDGLHGLRGRMSRKRISVRAHPLRLEYFEKGGHAGMLLRFKGPDTRNRWSFGQSHIFTARGRAPKGKGKSGFKEEAFFFRMGRNVPNLNGRKPNLVRTVGRVWYGSTARAWSGYSRRDNFAVRWSGYLGIRVGGTYSFWIASDDGSKLYIDNQLVINNDGLHGLRARQGRKSLGKGEHPLKLEFFERGGKAGMLFRFKGADTRNRWSFGQSNVYCSRALRRKASRKSGLKEETFYFRQGRGVPNLQRRRPNRVRTVGRVWYGNTNKAWPGFARRDNFAVRWTGLLGIRRAGSYWFWIASDDGSRLYVDRRLVVNNDGLHGMKIKQSRRNLATGAHLLKIEMFEKGGHAGMLLKLKGPDTRNRWMYGRSLFYTKQARSSRGAGKFGFKEEAFYFRMGRGVPNLRGRKPNLVRDVRRVWYASTRRPWRGFARSDNFAVRWSGFLKINAAGRYSFWVASDDGSKLYIGNQLVVNNDGLHGMRAKQGHKAIARGLHKLRLEFFEKTGGAGMLFRLKGKDTRNRWSYGQANVYSTKKAKAVPKGSPIVSSNALGMFREEAFFFSQGRRVPSMDARKPDIIRNVQRVWYPKTRRAWPGYRRGDNFACRWQGFLSVKAGGAYVFWVQSDDGSNLYVASAMIINNDGLHGMRSKQSRVSLRAGDHWVKLVYFEKGGDAGMLFKFKGADTGNKWSFGRNMRQMKLTPAGFKEEAFYFAMGSKMPNFTGRKPNLVRKVAEVWYGSAGGPGSSAAWDGFSRKNNFAVRWTGILLVRKVGMYLFWIKSDDGSRLYIDSKLAVNNDGLHGMRAKEGLRKLGKGPHSLSLEMFEKEGGAGMLFKYKGPDTRNAWHRGKKSIFQEADGNGWVPINAFKGYESYGTMKAAPPGVLVTGMRVTIMSDAKAYEALCEKGGMIAILSAGDKGVVKGIDKSDGSAKVAVGDQEAWVPIKGLVGFETWPKIPKFVATTTAAPTTAKPAVKKPILSKPTPAPKMLGSKIKADQLRQALRVQAPGKFTEKQLGSMTLEQLTAALEKLIPKPAGPTGPPGMTSYLPSGCRRTFAELDSYIANTAFTRSLGMSLDKCFLHCKLEEGMKYFAVTKGTTCICAPIIPGTLVSDGQCEQQCSGNALEMCGGVAGAMSVFTMIDCAAPSMGERLKDLAEGAAATSKSYGKFDSQTCGDAKDNLAELNGSAKLSGTVEQCKTACWEAKGADTCHGFSYDSVKSQCTFHTDVLAEGERKQKSGYACYWKKTGSPRPAGFDDFPQEGPSPQA